MPKFFRTNDRVRAPTVRLIDEKDEQVGLVAREKAMEMARAVELDMVEVAPNAKPPVCKIMDFGKFLYRQKKQDKKQKKQQKQKEVKGIRISMRIDTNDLQIKANKAIGFLKDRNSVKVQLILRGRELGRIEFAREKMKLFADMLKEVGQMEDRPKKQGHSLIMMVLPK